MRRKQLPAAEQSFVDRIRLIEERLFQGQLEEGDPARIKSHGKYSWLYRPSHHAAAGLLTQEDVTLLSTPGKRLLSIGAHPAFFERVLTELGVPVENMLLADKDPALVKSAGSLESVIFDMTGAWPSIGDFDRIIFPESLCIAISDTMKKRDVPTGGPHATDAFEAQLLTDIVRNALKRLRAGGIIRANGPMSHPNVVKATSATLRKEGYELAVKYQRFLLSIRLSTAT